MASPETSGSFQYQSTFMSYGFKPYGFKKASPDKTNIYWKALQHQEDYSTLSTNIKKACTDTVNYYDAKYNAVARYATYFHPKGVTAIVIGLQRDESIPGFHQDTYIVAFPATSSNKKWGVANKEIDNKSKLDSLLSTINHPLYGKLTDPMSKYISYDDVQEQRTNKRSRYILEVFGTYGYYPIFKKYGFEDRNRDYRTLSPRIQKAIQDTVDIYINKYNLDFSLDWGDIIYFHPKGVTAIAIGFPDPKNTSGSTATRIDDDLHYVVFPATASNKKWGVANKEVTNPSQLDSLLRDITHPVYGKLIEPMSKYISYDDVEEQVTRRLQECVKMLRRIRRKM